LIAIKIYFVFMTDSTWS